MEMNRKGNCLNFGNCPKADRKEIIELGITEDFVCPECNSDLNEILAQKSGGGKTKLVIVAVIAVLGLVGGGTFFALSGGEEASPAATIEQPTSATEQPASATTEQPANTATVPEVKPESVPEKVKTPAPEQQQKSSSVNFEFGSYKGETKNGKAHGMGTLYYSKHQLISTRDRQERYAESGDYLVGEFYNGEVVQGKLFDKSNSQKEAIIVGRPN